MSLVGIVKNFKKRKLIRLIRNSLKVGLLR